MKRQKTVRDGWDRIAVRSAVVEKFRVYCDLSGVPISTITAKALDYYAAEKLPALMEPFKSEVKSKG